MKQRKFRFRKDNLKKWSEKFPNIEEQVEAALSKSNLRILFLLDQQGKYFAAKFCSLEDNLYQLTPLVFVHGVTYGGFSDPFFGLKRILNKGFSRGGNSWNAEILHYSKKGDYTTIKHSRETMKKDLMGDRYLIEMTHLKPRSKTAPTPVDIIKGDGRIYSRDALMWHMVYHADTEDINPIVVFNHNLTRDEKRKRKEFYQNTFQNYSFRFIQLV
jgi:hypothetical protein